MGYHRAGFDVVGVDIAPQPHYPFEFVQAEAVDYIGDPGSIMGEFDAIHASPPCQAYTGDPRRRADHPELIEPVRRALIFTGLPYVIENVPGAPIDGPILCGATFGLPLIRHRRFEVNPPLLMVPSTCRQSSWERGTHHPGCYPYAHGAWRPAWRKHVLPQVLPWMTLEEAGEAVPPAYTEWIGRHLLTVIEEAA